MSRHLHVSVTFLDPEPGFHGRREAGEPEWPPSPLRLFQALVSATASRWRDGPNTEIALAALRWLAAQDPPLIVAPPGRPATPVRIAVPNNDMDIPAGFWAKRREPPELKSPQRLKAMKTVRPTRLSGGDTVHYLWALRDTDPEFERVREILFAAVRQVVALGWGVDLVAGNAEEVGQDRLDGLQREPGREVWGPTDDSAVASLRVPTSATLCELAVRHKAFLNRLSGGGYDPVLPLPKSAFRVVGYRRTTDPIGPAWAAFRIDAMDPDQRAPAFNPASRCREVAAWVRCATSAVCAGWSFGPIAGFVHGHQPDSTKPLKGEGADERFMYLPLPSIERRGGRGQHGGAIRRVLIAAPHRFRDRIDWIRLRLPGQDLVAEGGEVRGMLNPLPASDWVLRQYVEESPVWSTVTPVVLPGYDDPDHLRRRLKENRDATVQQRLLSQLNGRIEGLLRKALRQAGLADELADSAHLEWRSVGFRPGLDLARRYVRPENLAAFPAYHVRVRFQRPVPGPLAVGAGRYRGFGLFAVEDGHQGRRP